MNNSAPVGKISAKKRAFEQVVADMRHAVFAVTRHRPATGQQGAFQTWALGSGFFISSKIFVTCAHVVANPANPHQDGDRYDLVNNLGSGSLTISRVSNAVVGANVQIFPDADLAILTVDGGQPRAYLPLEYGDVHVGMEIGVAGYPLPQLNIVNGTLYYDGLIYRVARSVLTATYTTDISSGAIPPLTNIPVLEVNFLFVSGNSGGPIFAAETGRVLGFVHGYRTQKIEERVEKVSLIQNLPQEIGSSYIFNQSALYSLGIGLPRVRTYLETAGVTL